MRLGTARNFPAGTCPAYQKSLHRLPFRPFHVGNLDASSGFFTVLTHFFTVGIWQLPFSHPGQREAWGIATRIYVQCGWDLYDIRRMLSRYVGIGRIMDRLQSSQNDMTSTLRRGMVDVQIHRALDFPSPNPNWASGISSLAVDHPRFRNLFLIPASQIACRFQSDYVISTLPQSRVLLYVTISLSFSTSLSTITTSTTTTTITAICAHLDPTSPSSYLTYPLQLEIPPSRTKQTQS